MRQDFKNIIVLGAGESGNGAAILAKRKGLQVFVSDKGLIKENYKRELIEEGIEFEEGNHDEERILKADLIIKSPGIPDKAPLVKALRAAGILISVKLSLDIGTKSVIRSLQ